MSGIVTLAAAAGAVAGALLAVAALVRAVYRTWKRVDLFLSDWNGTPQRPGHPAVPPMPERVALLEQLVAHVVEQVTPNGGSTASLGDRVVRIENQVARSSSE